ncbi:hypothetical protein BHE74_00018974 [Ensete ventricosum]|nr:hypothetical protein BHE74_00018974 [Ensete ventricosum]
MESFSTTAVAVGLCSPFLCNGKLGTTAVAVGLALQSHGAFESPRAFSIQSPDSSRLQLCPEIVESTVSACPSDTIALSFFLWCARQPNYFHDSCSFDRMIPVVFRLTDRFGSVREIVREQQAVGCSVKAQTFMVLIRVYWRGNFYGRALEAFDEMIQQNYVPNTYARNMVLDILFKVHHFDVAMKFFRDTKFPNFISYNTVLSNLCKSSDWLGARDVIREMVKKGFHLNTGSFSVVLDCFCKARRLMELLQLLALMIVSGKQLTVAIWTILIESLCQAGQVDRASTLLGKMVEHGCSPTVMTYTSLIRGLFQAQKFNEVSVLLETMIFNKCIKQLLKEMEIAGVDMDHTSFNVIICLLIKLHRYNSALLLCRRITVAAFELFICSSGRCCCRILWEKKKATGTVYHFSASELSRGWEKVVERIGELVERMGESCREDRRTCREDGRKLSRG